LLTLHIILQIKF